MPYDFLKTFSCFLSSKCVYEKSLVPEEKKNMH